VVSDREPARAVVVTGAAGWLGQNLVRALVAQPARERIRCLVRNPDDAPLLEVLDRRIEVVAGDLRDPSAIDALFGGVPGAPVFHTAGVIHPRKAVRELFDVNVGGTQLVLDRARRVGAARFVHVSSNSPFGVNASPDERFDEDAPYAPYMGYGQSKMEAEQLVRRAGERGDLPIVILRPPWFYGPLQPERQTQFFASLRRGTFPLVGPGTQRRSMVYMGNLVQALLRAETASAAPGNAYWIADAEPYPLRTILETVRAALRAEGLHVANLPFPVVPHAVAALAARADGALQAAGRYLTPVHVIGELKDTIACDITRARKDLGYEPLVSLLEGMRVSVRDCLDRGLRL
jgi:nucleoside-diphosphate-sugar epimerase